MGGMYPLPQCRTNVEPPLDFRCKLEGVNLILLVDSHAHSQAEIAVHCPGCLARPASQLGRRRLTLPVQCTYTIVHCTAVTAV